MTDNKKKKNYHIDEPKMKRYRSTNVDHTHTFNDPLPLRSHVHYDLDTIGTYAGLMCGRVCLHVYVHACVYVVYVRERVHHES